MYDRKIDQITYEARLLAHEDQNRHNAKRRKEGKPPIDSFPKQEFKLPNDYIKMKNLKTFIIADELEEVKAMPVQELLQYLFRNMLIYECNLIFDNNFSLKYYYDTIRISKADYRRIFYSTVDKIPNSCHEKENFLYFRFDLNKLHSLNHRFNYSESGKARQYILFNFSFLYKALRLNATTSKAKDFLLFIISLYRSSNYPKIQHSLPKLLQACNFCTHSKKATIDRINKYFQYLQECGLLSENFLDYKFTVADLSCRRSLNIKLNPINTYYT